MNTIFWMLTVSIAHGQERASVIEDLGTTQIDWTDLRLEISSSSDRTVGAWQSWRGQEQEVIQILETLFPQTARDILIRPGVSASTLMTEGTELGLRIERGATSWHIEETRYHTSGGVDIDAFLDLELWLGPALRSEAIDRDVPLPAEGPTGIVIDARGVDFRPALAPTITMSSGHTLTRADRVARDTLETRGPVLYVSDPADQRALELAGNAPLFAIASEGGSGTLELRAVDWEMPSNLDALIAHGRVVIVASSIESASD